MSVSLSPLMKYGLFLIKNVFHTRLKVHYQCYSVIISITVINDDFIINVMSIVDIIMIISPLNNTFVYLLLRFSLLKITINIFSFTATDIVFTAVIITVLLLTLLSLRG